MGKYDVDSWLRRDTELTIIGLCKEIADELYERKEEGEDVKNEGKYYKYENLRDKIKNSDGSGIIDKIKNRIGFDIEEAAKKSDNDKFDMLRIVKCLYYIEKDGWPKSKMGIYDKTKKRIAITDILAKPSLENIPTVYSGKSEYGDMFQELYDSIGHMTHDSKALSEKIDSLDAYWDYITYKMFDYVNSDCAIADHEGAMNELNRIRRYVNERIRAKLEGCPPKVIKTTGGVADTFFTILACHKVLCNECDRININYTVVDEEDPSPEYVKKMQELDDRLIKWEVLDALRNGGTDDESVEFFEGLVSYYKGITEDEVKHYKYALKNAKTVAGWIEKVKGADFSETIWFTLHIAIVQEIMQIKKSGEKVQNRFYGYKYRYKSMMSALKKPNDADAIIVQAWIRRLENRISFNFGSSDLLKAKREIESDIFEIKKVLFSYHNLEDIISANELISRFVGRNMMGTGLAMQVYNRMANKICELVDTNEEIKDISIKAFGGAWDSINLFKELLLDTSGAEARIAREISERINSMIKRKNDSPHDYISRGKYKLIFYVKYGGERKHEQMMFYSIDIGNLLWGGIEVIINSFVSVLPDIEIKHLRGIGLDKFVLG